MIIAINLRRGLYVNHSERLNGVISIIALLQKGNRAHYLKREINDYEAHGFCSSKLASLFQFLIFIFFIMSFAFSLIFFGQIYFNSTQLNGEIVSG